MNRLFKICAWLIMTQETIRLTVAVLFLTPITIILLPFTTFFIIGARSCVQIGDFVKETITDYVESLKYIRKSLSKTEEIR